MAAGEPAAAYGPPVGAERALAALETALAASDADATEVFLAAKAGEYTRFADTRIHQPQDIVEQQVMVRVVVAGHAARAATSRIEGVAAAVRRACERARAQAAAGLPGGAHQVAAPAGRYPAPPVWHPDAAGWDAGERSRLAGEAMAAARAAGGAAYGMFGRAVTELAVATSAGVRVHTAATEAGGALTVKIGAGSSRWGDLGRSPGALDLPANIARTVQEARAARDPQDLPDGVYDVVLGPLAAAEFLDFFGAFGFTGAALADEVGTVAEHRGSRLASPLVTVADDALAPVGLPIGFDFEGVPKQRVVFLDRGRVGDAVTDLASAALLGRTPTGHAHIAREESPHAIPMNLVMSPGATPGHELVAGVERGVYVQRFWYTRVVDPAATTITGVSRDACFLIENGRLTRPVGGKRFTESVLGALSRVDAVGDRLASQPLMNTWNGCATAPALRIRGFRFGSRPAAGAPAAGQGAGRAAAVTPPGGRAAAGQQAPGTPSAPVRRTAGAPASNGRS